MTALFCLWAWSIAIDENSLQDLCYFWMLLIDGHHISEVNLKPPRIIHIVVCKEMGQKFCQLLMIQAKVGFSK